MTEKIKTMGKIEYGLGVVYGIIIAAYSAGLPVSDQVIIVAALFTAAYFGHWVMLLMDKWMDNQQLLKHLELEKRYAKETKADSRRTDSTPVSSL